MNTRKFNQFLNQISEFPIPVIDVPISLDTYIPIAISDKNIDLLNFEISSSLEWEKYIKSFLEDNNAKVAFGGYLEKRNIYDRSDYFKSLAENEKRNIHLGIDLWCNVNTKVLAVLDGEIHSFKNNTNYGDYGPTIILKHQIEEEIFYTLYGHLSLSSIESKREKISLLSFLISFSFFSISAILSLLIFFKKDIYENLASNTSLPVGW